MYSTDKIVDSLPLGRKSDYFPKKRTIGSLFLLLTGRIVPGLKIPGRHIRPYVKHSRNRNIERKAEVMELTEACFCEMFVQMFVGKL